MSDGSVPTDTRSRIVSARIDAVRRLLDQHDAAGVVLDTRRDFAWLTLGGMNYVLLTTETGVAPVIVTRDDAVVVAPVNEHDRIVEEELRGLALRTVSVPWWDDEATARQVRTSAGNGRLLSAADIAGDLEGLRSVLVPEEHGRLAVIADAVNATMAEALASVRSGDVEERLAGELGARLASYGARLPVILIAADERISRFRHPIPTDMPIRRRVMVVVVAERWGLHVAATQLRELEPRDEEVQRRAASISDVLARMREATRPGNTFDDVLVAARAAYADHGIENEWELHHQGGSIGYAARERVAKPGDRTVIRAGMAFAWNPSAVGYKAEETLYLDQQGTPQVLTSTLGETP